jgi:DNA-binding LytR/AlgR family response regulator
MSLTTPKLSVAIVEDELHARNILSHYIQQVPYLELVGQYDNCSECYEVNDFDMLDILLLDVNLPDFSGIQFARTLSKNRTNIIMTTAYAEHAVESYQFNVVDYLLKPITYERFFKAVEKARDLANLKKNNAIQKGQEVMQSKYIFIKSDHKTIKVNLDEIIYIESLQEYVRIYLTKGKPIVALLSLKKLEDILPSPPFFRIHRSHIINADHLEFIHQRSISIGGKELSIGKNHEETFYKYIHDLGVF